MQALPIELLLHVMTYLVRPKDILSLARTCTWTFIALRDVLPRLKVTLMHRQPLAPSLKPYVRQVTFDKDPVHNAWSVVSLLQDIQWMEEELPSWYSVIYVPFAIKRVDENELAISVFHDHLTPQFLHDLNQGLCDRFKVVSIALGESSRCPLLYYGIFQLGPRTRLRFEALRHLVIHNLCGSTEIASFGSTPYRRFLREFFKQGRLASWSLSFHWQALEVLLLHLCNVPHHILMPSKRRRQMMAQYQIEPKAIETRHTLQEQRGLLTFSYSRIVGPSVLSVRADDLKVPLVCLEFFASLVESITRVQATCLFSGAFVPQVIKESTKLEIAL